jgi:hypothetical protein
MLGAIFGLQLAGATRDGTLPQFILGLGIPPLAWVIGLPVLFGLGTLAVARFALALLLGGAVGTAVLLIGLGVVTQGRAIDGTVGGTTPTALTVSRHAEDDGHDFGRLVEHVGDHAVDRLVADVTSGEGAGWLPSFPSGSSLVPPGLADWWQETTRGIAAGTVDLVVALASVTGLCAGMLALLLPSRTAMVATSLCGGWLLSGTMVAAWARWMTGWAPPTPFITLLAWALLSGLGLLFQSRTRSRRSGGERD